MELQFVKNVTDVHFPYLKGEKKKYIPWDFEWRGMTEPERIKKGIFVFCMGMGDFEVFREGVDVKIAREGKMGGKKAKKERKEPKVMIDIRIQVLDTGEIKIDAPPNLDIFHEVITQAERIMKENYAQKQKVVELQKKKLILLN